MAEKRGLLPWRRKEQPAPSPVSAAPAAPAVPAATAPPLPRAPVVPHHWLTVAVARAHPVAPIPVAGARVVVRPYPRGAPRPLEPVARGTTSQDGTVALFLPAGRYAVSGLHEGQGRAVTITLEHAGRALLVLEDLVRRATLTVEATGLDGRLLVSVPVQVRSLPAGTVAAQGVTDMAGACALRLPPGAYEVRVGEASARTYLDTDTKVRLCAAEAPAVEPAPVVGRYAQKARAATSYAAPFDVDAVRDDLWN